MIRCLHVIDQPTVVGEALTLRLSVDAAHEESRHNAEARHAWLLIGGEATRDAAYAAGLTDEQFCLSPMPRGLHRLMPRSMHKAEQLMSQAHRVVCWTEGASEVASLLGCAKVARRCEQAALTPFAKHLIDTTCDRDVSSKAANRAAIRERWGVDDDTIVIALLADRVDAIDSSAALLATVFTHEVLRASDSPSSDVRLLCHPDAWRRIDAATLSEQLHFPELLMQDAGLSAPWSVLAGCDVALAPKPSEAGLSILWANAMGVPVVAAPDARLPLLSELEQVLLASSGSPRHLANALTQWVQSHQAACA